ncbi:hypothetical protein ACFWBH_22885 [Streptomyces sp. NPDC059999]
MRVPLVQADRHLAPGGRRGERLTVGQGEARARYESLGGRGEGAAL